MKKKKIILGCANVGKKYGLRKKNLKLKEFEKIFKFGIKNNIYYFDTAADYGKSEKFLGNVIGHYRKNIKIITKLPKRKKFNNFDQEIQDQVLKSIKRLGVKSLYTLHIHEPNMLLKKDRFKIYNSLLKLKKRNLIKNIGVSVYTVAELKKILKMFKIDVVQIPINLLDNRFIKNNFLKKIKSKVKEIHARSIFLKGLLLKDKISRPKYFDRWPILRKMDNYFNQRKVSRLATCINFVFSFDEIDKVIIGVSSKSQLSKILKIQKKAEKVNTFPNLNVADNRLLIPKYWKI